MNNTQNDKSVINNTPGAAVKKRIMVAGIGNIFLQDDGFGVSVIKKLREKEASINAELNDVSTGGLKLAYDLMKGYDALILVDVVSRGEKPGTIFLIEPDGKDISNEIDQGGPVDPHGSDPATVLRFLKALNTWPNKVYIVGCEPESVSDFEIGLSNSVKEAVDRAIELVEQLVNEIHADVITQ